MAALSINPGRINPSATTTVSFIGTGTTWLSGAPTFSATGAPAAGAGWSLAAVSVVDDLHATLAITAGATVGTVTFTDSTTSATTTLTVARKPHRLVWRRQR